MKAAIFENPGLENLRVMDNIKEPQVPGHDVLIKVKVAGINPLPNHIPGAEISGVVEEVRSHINGNNLRIGDRVIVHNKIFDGTCDMCLNGLDMICRNGGLISE